jgi:hypothetical protein
MTLCCLEVPASASSHASGLVRLCQGRGRGEAAAGGRFEHPGVRGSPHRVKGIAEILSCRTLAYDCRMCENTAPCLRQETHRLFVQNESHEC